MALHGPYIWGFVICQVLDNSNWLRIIDFNRHKELTKQKFCDYKAFWDYRALGYQMSIVIHWGITYLKNSYLSELSGTLRTWPRTLRECPILFMRYFIDINTWLKSPLLYHLWRILLFNPPLLYKEWSSPLR